MSEINQVVRELADKLKPEIKIDEKSGISKVSSEVFEKNLPEGVTAEQCKQVWGAIQTYKDASALATGEVGVEFMSKNKEVPSVTAEFGALGHNHIDHTVLREHTLRNPKTQETTTVPGYIMTDVSISAVKRNAEYARVRQAIEEQAKKLLG